MHGSKFTSALGNYGTKGVPAATNEPPGRYQACYWTDAQSNFWLFGGVMNSSGGIGLGNDLWKFDVTANVWTWISGPNVTSASNPAGVTGTKGVPSVNNYPSARGYGANCWTDRNGDLWLYGGYGGFNDLWKYHIATNEWTWVNGQTTGAPTPVYGTLGIPASGNTPGTLNEVKSAWVDAANNLWMFGGNSSNTMWRYTISTDQWTWMSGSGTVVVPANYGTYRVEAATNMPGGRLSYTRWKDASDNMYIFAGTTSGGTTNDLWRYRPSTGMWTWLSGPNTPGDTGKYPPQKCTFYDNYYPPSRYENQTAFTINTGSSVTSCSKAFWTFGGFTGAGMYNDLWLYSSDSLKWCWVSGTNKTNDTGNYGTLGTGSPANLPRARGGQCMWIDAANNLWLFGGYGLPGYSLCNDLWKFQLDPACIDISVITSSTLKKPDTVICLGDKTVMTIGAHKQVIYSPGTGVLPNFDTSTLQFSPRTTTAYKVIIIGGNCRSVDSTQFTIEVKPRDTVKLAPPYPLALCVGDTARMKVKPEWTIGVYPSANVLYGNIGGSEVLFYPSANTSYAVYASNNDRCAISPDSVKFTITNDGTTHHLAPMADTILCKGDTATYTAIANLKYWYALPNDFTYGRGADSATFIFYPPATTTYRFIGIQTTGCKPHDTIDFTIHRSRIKAAFDLAPRETDLTEPAFELTNASIAATGYNWYQNGAFLSAGLNATARISDTGKYCFLLAARDELSCTDTAIDCGVVLDPHIYLPSAFSPNGDGKNDVFRAMHKDLSYTELAVYNRYGERVFISYDRNVGWDGNYGGKPCEMGVYFYYLKYRILKREPVYLKGELTLIR